MARGLLSSDGLEVEDLVGNGVDFEAAAGRAIHLVEAVREPS